MPFTVGRDRGGILASRWMEALSKYKYTNTNGQTQTHKYRCSNTNTQGMGRYSVGISLLEDRWQHSQSRHTPQSNRYPTPINFNPFFLHKIFFFTCYTCLRSVRQGFSKKVKNQCALAYIQYLQRPTVHLSVNYIQ